MMQVLRKKKLPLCIDCDGTLVDTDLLHESLLLLVKQSFFSLWKLPFWFLNGKPFFKRKVAETVSLDVSTLPYNVQVIELIRKARMEGRSTILVTAAPTSQAEAVAKHLGLFDEVIASDDQVNLKGTNKAEHLAKIFGRGNFVYAGNSVADLPVWEASGGAIVVGNSKSLADAAGKLAPLLQSIVSREHSLRTWVRAIRVHQWIKNLLVFVPVLAAHELSSFYAAQAAFLAFLAFCLCSSAVYVINDLLDLPADRLHARKKDRPFASGKLSVLNGLAIAALLLVLAAAISAFLPLIFVGVLSCYFVVTCLYSCWLKGQVVVDVMLLASLYTLRILAGAAATSIVPSFWLLAFSMFMFLSLALIKRYSEMLTLHQQNRRQAPGRGYEVSDEPVLLSLGSAAGYGSVLIMALYINSLDIVGLYPNRLALWLVPPALLYWISRCWLKAHRGEIHDDPLVFAVTDRQSWGVAVWVAGSMLLASLHW